MIDTIQGTSHFESFERAVRYYSVYHEDREAVNEKITLGEISIGKPTILKNQTVHVNDEGRYCITTKVIEKMVVGEETQAVLKECKIDGLVVTLPDVQLDRKEYVAVKSCLEGIGGKWKGGKIQGFVFEHDPAELLAEVASGVKRNLKKEFQFFPTPEDICDAAVAIAELEPHHTILEPEVGRGAFLIAIKKEVDTVPDVYELMDQNVAFLESSDLAYNLVGRDFLKDNNGAQYDRILANPPFTKNQDIDHIMQMYANCKPEGMVISMASNHWRTSNTKKCIAFRDFLESQEHRVLDFSGGAFTESGTSIATCMVVIEKGSHE